MPSHASGTHRRYRKSFGRRVCEFSELNHDLRPEQIAKVITVAGLEQARLEAAAQADALVLGDGTTPALKEARDA